MVPTTPKGIICLWVCDRTVIQPISSQNAKPGARALNKKSRKRRHRKNVITAFGHFVSLVAQTLLITAVVMLHLVFQRDIGMAFW